mgnify:CR=1 FL=1
MYRLGQKEVDEVAKVINARQMFRVGDPKNGHLQECDRFEKEWAKTIGVKRSLLLSGGGTAALMAGLAGMGIERVDGPRYRHRHAVGERLAIDGQGTGVREPRGGGQQADRKQAHGRSRVDGGIRHRP